MPFSIKYTNKKIGIFYFVKYAIYKQTIQNIFKINNIEILSKQITIEKQDVIQSIFSINYLNKIRKIRVLKNNDL